MIKGNLNYGCWKVSSAVYELDPLEAMSKQERTAFTEQKNSTAFERRANPPEETDETRRAAQAENG